LRNTPEGDEALDKSIRDGARGVREAGIFFELLEVASSICCMRALPLEEVGLKTRRELAGHDEELIVDHFRKRDGSAGGNEVCAPLEHEAGVPEDEEGQDSGDRSESRSAGSGRFERSARGKN